MSKNRQQLANKALSILKVTQTGQQADAEDYAIANDDIDGMIDDIETRDIYGVTDLSFIDDQAFLPLAQILAQRISEEFGAVRDETKILSAELKLRELSDPNYLDKTVQQDYF